MKGRYHGRNRRNGGGNVLVDKSTLEVALGGVAFCVFFFLTFFFALFCSLFFWSCLRFVPENYRLLHCGRRQPRAQQTIRFAMHQKGGIGGGFVLQCIFSTDRPGVEFRNAFLDFHQDRSGIRPVINSFPVGPL